MSRPRARWMEPEPIRADLPRLHHDPLLHELLVRRGVTDPAAAAAFLDRRRRHAPDAAELPNGPAAVQRIGAALAHGERMGIFGDYDADGVTATALLTTALRAASRQPELVLAALPTREAGYGLNCAAIEAFAKAGVTLLIAVDCGSSDHEPIAHARSLGLDVVVLDHHQIPGEPAIGAIVVSPQLPGGERLTDLCAAGVAYLIVAALAQDGHRIDGESGEPETALLDFVALGAIADMVPVGGVNRALIRDGLAVLRQGRRPGIAALARRAGIDLGNLTADQIAFKLGPRLNAAGRMGDPTLALDLLLETDVPRATKLADQLEALNHRRKTDSAKVLAEAEQLIKHDPGLLGRSILVVSSASWHPGLLGPAAAQLVDRYRRPVIVLRDDGTVGVGSARSIPGFDIACALEASRDLLIRFGGHGQAAGLTIGSESLPLLIERLESEFAASGLETAPEPALRLDCELPVERLTLETCELIDLLQPFGVGNQQPLLLVRDVGVRQWEAVGADKTHLRVQLGWAGGAAKAIAFGMADRSRELLHHRRIDLAAAIKLDRWNGQRRLDVEIKDFRPAER